MTVEALDHMMTYVIEAWMLLSGAYLGVGFTWSLIQRMAQDIKAELSASEQLALTTENVVTDESIETERLAAVTAVSKQYAKTLNSETVTAGVSIAES